MPNRYPPINPRCRQMLHGGDYNPDQWIQTPAVWDEDMRLMKLAGCNAMTIGVFAWSALEPAEGHFVFGWLDTIMDKLADQGMYAVLATPSGAKPAWMSRAYPEVRQVDHDGKRHPHGSRHNHCRTSPVYREKCRIINTHLAQRYKGHPALLLWHASNEYNGGDCHCALCYAAFRDWLKVRYDHDINKLNHAYWSSFWSHTFPDWSYVEPTDHVIHGLMLDWERFKTAQTIDFYHAETAPLREITPEVPITTNFMPESDTLDYAAFARCVDVVSWDSYPCWHEQESDVEEAVRVGLVHDQCRAMKGGRPFMIMESVPSVATRGRIKKRKLPGMHLLSSLQAVAHGSDTIQYFQWRKSRGGGEKFHGAVVDHFGREHTRVFQDVATVGQALARLDALVGTTVHPEVALIQDWENEWALNTGGRVYLGENVKYREECVAHYRPFWAAGVPVDVIDQTQQLAGYKLVVVPMAYMLRPGFAQRLQAFVATGGTAVMTYWSGIVDESDLCYLGGVPGDGLREVFGVREEESQSYFPGESNSFRATPQNDLGLSGTYTARDTCSVIHPEGATVLASYADDYFAGSPALTLNAYGRGQAYYLACRSDGRFLADFYNALIARLDLTRALDIELPHGVTAQSRSDGERHYVFLMNFNDCTQTVVLPGGFVDLLSGDRLAGVVPLDRYAVKVLTQDPGTLENV